MHCIYRLANENAEEVLRIYQDRYVNRIIPCAVSLERYMQDYVKFAVLMRCMWWKTRNLYNTTTPGLEDVIIDAIIEDPSSTTRKIAL